uniref:Integrase zinc-binding domain-containing protein n=1 Tax=Nicotiana tabacum TaxID=4097 RepID=A0A1S3ZVR5_TOBAC|nr:PREDICTED: uncharacterized protein LOC107791019 [Nicotiana tabacum]
MRSSTTLSTERWPKTRRHHGHTAPKQLVTAFEGQLYKRSFKGPFAQCIGASEASYVMREVHEGICGNHSGADSLVLKLYRAGYYWPRMEQDIKAIIQKCDKCQHHVPLEAAKGKWPDELLGVFWAYRTTTKSSTRDKPFSLVYDAEALIPVEVGELTLRYFPKDEETNNEALLDKLELLDECRDLAYIRMVDQKQRIKRYYN